MIAIVSDTHGTTDHRLTGRTLEAVREATAVIHAGDFNTEAVYDAFEAVADRLVAVQGNNDDAALRRRLPAVATCDLADTRFVVAHGHEHTETSLAMLARQEDADVVVVGHSHRPELSELAGRLLVNPGSHADPRRYRPAHAEVELGEEGREVRLVTPDGAELSEVRQ